MTDTGAFFLFFIAILVLILRDGPVTFSLVMNGKSSLSADQKPLRFASGISGDA